MSKKCVTIGLVFFMMLVLNHVIPFTADDFTYGYASNGLIMSIKFAWLQYHIWDGRIITSIITSYLLQRDGYIDVFNVINSIMFIFYCIQVYQATSSKFKYYEFLFVLGIISISFKDFGEVILWKTAAIQYVWGVVLYLYLFKVINFNTIRKINYGDYIISFIAAFWLQNINPILILMMLSLIITNVYYRQSRQFWILFCSYCIGSMISLLAPGNQLRKAFVLTYQTDPRDLDLSYKLAHFCSEIFYNSGWFMAAFIILLIYSRKYLSSEVLNKVKIYFIFGVAVNAVMLLFPAGVWTSRTWFAGNSFMLVACLIIVIQLFNRFKLSKTIKLLSLALFIVYGVKYYQAYEFYELTSMKTTLFINELKRGKCDEEIIHNLGIKYDLRVLNNGWKYSFTPDYQPKHLCGYIQGKYYNEINGY